MARRSATQIHIRRVAALAVPLKLKSTNCVCRTPVKKLFFDPEKTWCRISPEPDASDDPVDHEPLRKIVDETGVNKGFRGTANRDHRTYGLPVTRELSF